LESATTFESVAKEWLALKDWEDVTKARRQNMMERVIFPKIEAAIDLHSEDGAPKLKPVYDLFEGRYDYGKLRCVAAAGRT